MECSRRSFVVAAAGSLGVSRLATGGGRAWSQEPERSTPGEGDSPAVLAAMRRIARSVQLRDLEGDPPGRPLPLREDPLLRYSDPPRGNFDATLWAWTRGDTGRPMAALKVEFQPTRIPARRWLLGLVSLAPGKIEAVFHDGDTWTSAEPGFVPRPIADAPAPVDSAAQRLAQARGLSRRFVATEYAAPARNRLSLRLMPRPLLRFSEPDAGLRDGVLFAYAYGTNPDVLIVLEAHDRPEPPGWRYGIGRLGGAEGSVTLDGQNVWTVSNADPPRRLATYMNRRVAEGDAPK